VNISQEHRLHRMNNLLDVPIASVTALTPERAVVVARTLLRAECIYAKANPAVLTISSRLTIADGGIDAEVNLPPDFAVPTDCMFMPGLTGFQVKSGTAFKPWTSSAIRNELVDSKGNLCSEVERLLRRRGRYTLLCTGYDLTPEQRLDSRKEIAKVLERFGFTEHEQLVDVFGASQIADFAERYPGPASLLALDPIHEAWVLDEWQRDDHMTNAFQASSEQSQLITRIRTALEGDTKHIRVLGEPGLGKTRIVLESVKDPNIGFGVLYVQHGSRFGQSRLFRQLIRSGHDKPLVLIIDELPESELADLWRHLKPRCGRLKIVSLDHGTDKTHDDEIDRLVAPRLSDDTIKKILANRIGNSRELDRWVAICEGSPRVAQAVAENLLANPDDLLKPPSTVPLWSRFLHGYDVRDEGAARQVDCVTQHLALFSRFGYEAPVGNEAEYISELVRKIDPTIGWARFQEIVQSLRARRVLQGSRTLFFVPRALHIYLWRHFWECYGRGFDFAQIFSAMPESLHAWFMSMFKFAEGKTTAHVINEILRRDGIFSEPAVLTSPKGSRFLSNLAEANPQAVLKLLEVTIGQWTDQDLFDFKEGRQHIIGALEKIAVWSPFAVRAFQLLARLAVNENSNNSNNATGTLIGLFRIGPEESATETTPQARLPAMQTLLRSPHDVDRLLGLKAMNAALDSHGMGYRVIGPEYQGLRERAKLWMPKTYDEWWQAKHLYFETLVNETRNWPSHLHGDVCQALLSAVKEQIKVPPCTELAFQTLGLLVSDGAMSSKRLNSFFSHSRNYQDEDKHLDIAKRLRRFERRHTRRTLASRFQRYVIDVSWMDWDEDFRERSNKSRNRAKILVNALAHRIANNPENFDDVQGLLSLPTSSPALWHFGQYFGLRDKAREFMPALIQVTLKTKQDVCLHGYLSAARTVDATLYLATVRRLLDTAETAWLGATLTLQSDYNDDLFVRCLDALENRWIDPSSFGTLRYGKALDSVPPERMRRLFYQLSEHDSKNAMPLLIEFLDATPINASAVFPSSFVFQVVSRSVPDEEDPETMRGYHWKNVCLKMIERDSKSALPMLDILLTRMGTAYRLSYDSDVAPIADQLARADPRAAWGIVKAHLEDALPKWRSDIFNWLKGGIGTFGEKEARGVIADLPVADILAWVDEDPKARAALMAHAAPRSLEDAHGGRLTRELLHRYGQLEGLRGGISATFHTGGWSGPTSVYLKKKRERLRGWLAAGFEIGVIQWIEAEIDYLDKDIEREEINEERSRFD
jgi:hypothetical protein